GWAWELVRLGGGSDRGGGRRGGDSCVGALSVRGGRGASAVRPWYGRRAASTPADCEIRPLTVLNRRWTVRMPFAGADGQSRKASESVTGEGASRPGTFAAPTESDLWCRCRGPARRGSARRPV